MYLLLFQLFFLAVRELQFTFKAVLYVIGSQTVVHIASIHSKQSGNRTLMHLFLKPESSEDIHVSLYGPPIWTIYLEAIKLSEISVLCILLSKIEDLLRLMSWVQSTTNQFLNVHYLNGWLQQGFSTFTHESEKQSESLYPGTKSA